MTTPRPAPPHRLATTVTTLVVPLLLVLVTVLVALSWTPRLPDPLAVHWDAAMRPDGYGSLKDAVAIPLLFAPLFAVGMWALAFWAGRDTATRRIAAGSATGLTVLMSVVVLGSLSVQLDLADAADVPGIGHVIAWAFAGGIVAGVLAALVVPRDAPMPSRAPVDPAAPRTPLANSERAAWSRTVTSPAGAWVGGAAVLVNVVLALALRTPALLIVAAALGLLLATMLVLRVSVDARGLVARSPLGWPTAHVPLDEVVAARAIRVDPFGEFGGWGYRIGHGGRAGFVLRKGEGIEVERTGGRVLVVTVDDAATGAALLNTLADRARSAATAG
ncbi:DUF1648 domain-containing protein [Cellulomonas wangsupingiae]|uniref:DUF1648 domain-containing protein n=1 Tax=Cellulomonas wangsupingiae TaxID=2968085 RepID=A0ABY5K845_9CELL|nr:DUF1648 domain-containing protein [Cellulomonas wangsupingiae]MCC2334585.1 DUF1648 domain-containing protein [Cellulomonas wangsupingiae]MCM0638694.1 DUF1648 domain-containing protein [Cellulomonas wangsupingiae]UUI66449.1 DUF1648 domain-containing protein [Cellulomonas wangsupingiae]